MSRIIITGGTGLIGRALAFELAAAENEVIILSRHASGAYNLPQSARVHAWDAKTAEGWSALASGAAAIVNLAGESIAPMPWTAERRRRILQSRVDAGRAVVEAVRAAEIKPRVVIQASAVGYYGLCGDEQVTEETPPGDDFLAHVCRDWEESSAPLEQLGVRRVIIRTGLVLSRDGGVFPLIAMPFRFFVGGRIGNGRQYTPWIHIVDHARAICFLIGKATANGPLNLTAPNPVTNAEFSRALGETMGRPALIPTPGFALRLVFGDMAKLMLLGGQRAVPKHLQEMGFQFRFPDLQSALSDLLRPAKESALPAQ